MNTSIIQIGNGIVVTDHTEDFCRQYKEKFLSMGYTVMYFNPADARRSVCYNPLAHIQSDRDAEMLAKTIIESTNRATGQPMGGYWEKGEAALLSALFAYLHSYVPCSLRNFQSVLRLIRTAERPWPSMVLDMMFSSIEMYEPGSYAVGQYGKLKTDFSPSIFNILISCAVRLQAFDDPEIGRLTASDDVRLNTFGNEKTVLFVIVPADNARYINTIADMLLSQLMQQARVNGYSTRNFDIRDLF